MSRTYTLQEIATAIDGRVVGDGTLQVSHLVHPADIAGTNDLVLAMDSKLLPLLKDRSVKAAVVAEKNDSDSAFLTTRILVARPRLAMARLTALFAMPVTIKQGIHPMSVIEEGVTLGKNVAIGAFVYIGAGAVIGDHCAIHPQAYIGEGSVIGANALIHAGVKIGAGTKIGERAIIHFNASIGADGFSFVTPQLGSVEAAKADGGGDVTASNTLLIRISSLAPVILGDDIEIGANSSIDRGTIVSTRIGNGTKIDNQVQIGHNVTIGENCMICGCVGIAGSANIGNRVVLGGAACLADHITIGDDAIVMAMSGIAGNVPARTIVGGVPAKPREKMMENFFNIGRLPRFFRKIKEIDERLGLLEKTGQ